MVFRAMPLRVVAAVILLLATVASAELVIREAGAAGSYGPRLVDGTELCPSDYAATGLSIECRDVPGPVQFFLNGEWIRTENVAPYMIAGDSNGVVFAWNPPTSDFTVECHYSGMKKYANVKIFCPPKSSTSTSTSTSAAGATQTPTPLPTQAPSPPPMTMSKSSDCIKIKGNMHMGLSNGWTEDGTSVWYRKGSTFGGVVPGGTADLEYMFVSPATGTFGITLDMTTHDVTDYNDVWIKFPYGLYLRKIGEVAKKVNADHYEKAYHNQNGQAVAAWAVDNNHHAISTGMPLRAGMMYKIVIGARSANVKLNSIIMFPCEGDECTPSSPTWNAGVFRCK